VKICFNIISKFLNLISSKFYSLISHQPSAISHQPSAILILSNTRKISIIFFVCCLLVLQGCLLLPGKGKNTIVINSEHKSKLKFNPNLISINVASDIVTIQGSGFAALKKLEVQTASGTTASLNVDTLSDSQIIASAKSAISLLVGTTFNLIMSSAEASTTFPITFTLQDGVVTSTKLHSMGALNGQVLQFNGTNWLPTSIASPMLFIGMWDASSGSPTPGAYSSGDYFIVSGAGSYGTDNYVVGDWAVYDGTDWNRVFTDTGTKLSKTGGTLTGDLILDTQAKFKGGANYVTLKASAGLASDITLTLPTSVGTNGQVLTTDGAGVMSWQTITSGGGGGSVFSVNSQTGTVTLTTTDIAEGTNQYFTTARAQAALTASLASANAAVTASLALKQDLNSNLTALSSYNTNGILVQTAANTFTGRTLTGTTNRLTVTNGSGVAGDPTINLDTTLFPSPVLGDVGKFLKVTGADASAWTALVSSDITTALGFTPINKAGDTLTGTLTLAAGTFTIGPSGFLIVPNPVLLTDAVNKQYVDGLLGAPWTASGADAYRASGNVAIGTTTTTGATLTVAGTASISGQASFGSNVTVTGGFRPGSSTAVTTCNATTEGQIRYNYTTHGMEFCNGTSWTIMQVSTCSQYSPTFSFTNIVNQTTSTLVTSNIVQITGINCLVPATVSGAGSPQFQICSDAACGTVVQSWTAGPAALQSGQYVQLRQTTSGIGGLAVNASVIIGGGAAVWSATTTGSCAGLPSTPPPIGTVCADGTVYAGTDPDTLAPMYTTPCDLGMTWNGSACTGTRTLLAWNNGTGNWTVTGIGNFITGKANTASLTASADVGSPYSAAIACYSLNANSYSTGWFLPAKDELNTLYVNLSVIGGFGTGNYWSSSESANSNAWYQSFSSGSQGSSGKNTGYVVRCVRR